MKARCLDTSAWIEIAHGGPNARRFLYWQLYRSSLSFGEYLEPDDVWAGYVKLKEFDWQTLLPSHSETMAAVTDGILHGGNFMLKEERE